MRIATYSAVSAVLLLAAPLVGQEDTPAADLPGTSSRRTTCWN